MSFRFGVRNAFSLATVFLLTLILLSARYCEGEQLKLVQFDHTSWTARDGAPHGISQIVQDRDGTLWLATEGGLYNFNGKTFTPFHTSQGDSVLPSFPISNLYVSTNGSLWVGFAIFGIVEIRDHHVIHVYSEKDGLPTGQVKQIAEAPDGTMIAISRDRLMQLRSGHWEEAPSARSLLGQTVTQVSFDSPRTLWVVTVDAVWRLPSGANQFEKVWDGGSANANFLESPDGSLWVFLAGAGRRSGTLRRLPETNNSNSPTWHSKVNTVGGTFANDGAIWMPFNEGVVRWIPKDPKRLEKPTTDMEDNFTYDIYRHSDGLSSDSVDDLMQDSSGDMWIATSAGLDRFRKPTVKRFVDEKLFGNVALTECPDGALWMSDPAHVGISLEGGKATVLRGEQRNPSSAHCDSTNVVWLPAKQGLDVIRNNKIYHEPTPPQIDPSFTRQVVGKDEHLLFVSVTRNGLWRFADGIWSRVLENGFPKETPFSLFLDGQNRLWTGYIDGRVAMLDEHSAQTFAADTVHPLGLVQVLIHSNHGLLVGGSNGIAVLRGDHLQTLLFTDELAAKGVSGLLQAKNGDLWLNGIHGVARIPAGEFERALASSDYRIHSYLYSEAGITGPSPQALQLPSAVADHNGTFWFATSDTVVSVDPSSVHPSMTSPILGGISTTVDGVALPLNHEISPGYHTVRIRYFGAYITAPERVVYRYKLDREDKTWQEVGDRSEAVYTGLRPGLYRFSVAASNGEGAWSSSDNSLAFTVLPSFYQRPIFLVLCIAAAIGIIWISLRWRVKHLAALIKQRAEIRADERIRIARDLHDTLLQGVQALTLRFHVVSQNLPESSRDRKAMEAALTSADRVVLEARNRVSHLRAQNLHDKDLVRAFGAIAAELDYEKRVRFTCEVEGQMELGSPVMQELFYIGREALTNAYRHSRASEVAITLRHLAREFVLSVTDNGCGFDPNDHLKFSSLDHWGFQGMKERAHAIGATFECVSVSGTGTTILVKVSTRVTHESLS